MDEEYRKLVRRYKAGDTGLASKIINHAFRSGITLIHLKEDGLPWPLVRSHLHLLNPVIPTPQAHRQYLENVEILHPDWDPKFIEKTTFYVPTSSNESWYASWPEDKVSMSIAFWGWMLPEVGDLSPRKLRKKGIVPNKLVWEDKMRRDKWGTAVRICFWGTDDYGIERDLSPEPFKDAKGNENISDYPDSLVILDDLLRRLPPEISREWLFNNGFNGA